MNSVSYLQSEKKDLEKNTLKNRRAESNSPILSNPLMVSNEEQFSHFFYYNTYITNFLFKVKTDLERDSMPKKNKSGEVV